MAGMACAASLHSHGYDPVVLEKSRGLGGRLATRRVNDMTTFDHGAQFVTARSPAFRAFLQAATDAGTGALWLPGIAGDPVTRTSDWVVGTPAMNALVKPLADGVEIRLGQEVNAVERTGKGWRIRTVADPGGDVFDAVVCTAPAPQAQALLAAEAALSAALDTVTIAPCWALMVAFATPLRPGFEVRRSSTDDLAWLASNSAKPQRATSRDCWIAHASPSWSAHWLEQDRQAITAAMLKMLQGSLAVPLPEIVHADAHRWRYAMTTTPLAQPFLASGDGTLFVGGDWCLGARIECAHASGEAIADALVSAAAA